MKKVRIKHNTLIITSNKGIKVEIASAYQPHLTHPAFGSQRSK